MSCPPTAIMDSSKLNIEGIVRLQRNQTGEAIRCFSDGLRGVLATLQTVSAAEHMMSNSDWKQPQTSANDILFSVHLCQRTQVSNMATSGMTATCGFAIYSRALHLSLDSVSLQRSNNTTLSSPQQNHVPAVYCHLLCGVFLYNLGLSHHLLALENGCSQSLYKALEFYSVAHRTLSESNLSPQTRFELHQLGTLAFLALTNNVGHIHAILFNQEQTKICGDAILNRLSSLLGPVNKQGSAIDYDALLDEAKEYREFMLNASFFLGSDLMPAPAA